PDDIQDRVDGADFVQVDFLDRHAVHLTLDAGDRHKRGVSLRAHGIRRTGRRDDLPDRAHVSPVWLWRNVEVDFHTREPRALDLGDVDANALQPQARRQCPQPLGIETAGDERAQGHVAGNAAERIKYR